MQVLDFVTNRWVNEGSTHRVLIEQVNGIALFGHTSSMNIIYIGIYVMDEFRRVKAYKPTVQKDLVFSKYRGYYISKVGVPSCILFRELNTLGSGSFPYSFNRYYEAIDNFEVFSRKQKVIRYTKNKISDYLKYSFGLEFETSQGYIPEDICFRDGLIPLRDGSISGLEYSTVVLEGNAGICLLKQQLKTLREYTVFNKECSLHIHFGNFPIEADALFRLYSIWIKLESELGKYLPILTFRSSEYKKNGKNYCKKLPIVRNFNELYERLVGRPYLGSLTQPHPLDITRDRKWNVTTRYYALNFINAFCYNVNKTIEFRFLRPTYNYNKILLWMYIFNAMLAYAEKHVNSASYNDISLKSIIRDIYPSDLAENLIKGIQGLFIVVYNQTENDDYIGANLFLEDKIFRGNMNF